MFRNKNVIEVALVDTEREWKTSKAVSVVVSRT